MRDALHVGEARLDRRVRGIGAGEIARVAGLVFPGFPRSGKTARQLQASSGLFFDVFQRYDPDNLFHHNQNIKP